MLAFDELHSQNHKLIESANILKYLFQERSMCDTDTACSLLYAFIDNLNHHMGMVDSLYQALLCDKESSTNNTARMFMSGEQELKRIINQYTKKWCVKKRQQLNISNHDQFKRDTEEIFHLVFTRIQNETEHLYPLVKEIRQKKKHAA